MLGEWQQIVRVLWVRGLVTRAGATRLVATIAAVRSGRWPQGRLRSVALLRDRLCDGHAEVPRPYDEVVADTAETVVRQLTSVVDGYDQAVSGNRDRGDGEIDRDSIWRFMTRSIAAIERAALPESIYIRQMQAAGTVKAASTVEELVAIVRALRDDYADGAMQGIEELVHADLFDDFVDMASELQSKAFRGPAVVLAGSLEEHVHKLAVKHGISLDRAGRPKSFDALSVGLRDSGLFPEAQRKTINAWYALRNDAAHGRAASLVDPDIERMIAGVRDFIARYPA